MGLLFFFQREERKKGLYISYDEEEFHTPEEFYQAHIDKIPGYFKIELLWADDDTLNSFKKAHPELKVEDY